MIPNTYRIEGKRGQSMEFDDETVAKLLSLGVVEYKETNPFGSGTGTPGAEFSHTYVVAGTYQAAGATS